MTPFSPGEKGVDKTKWLTILTPTNRNHDGKIRANSREELEEKIIAYYLKLQDDTKLTVREMLIKAVGPEHNDTVLRLLQRFDKHLSVLSNIKISSLDEKAIRHALTLMVKGEEKLTGYEFKQTMTALHKIADHCEYEHIEVCDIRKIVSVWKSVKLTGHHEFAPLPAKSKEQAFTKEETILIVRDALLHPTYKSLAIATVLLTGLRAGEILALSEEDINLDEGFIYIWKKEHTKKYTIEDYTKSNRQRYVYLSDDAKEVLRLAITLRQCDSSTIPYLFLNDNSDDGKMHLRALDNHLRGYVHKNVLTLSNTNEARSTHDCRRTYASTSYFAGTDIYVIQQQLGHSTVDQTWEYIRDIIDAEERKTQLKSLNIADSLDAENNEKNNIISFVRKLDARKSEENNTLKQQKTL